MTFVLRLRAATRPAPTLPAPVRHRSTQMHLDPSFRASTFSSLARFVAFALFHPFYFCFIHVQTRLKNLQTPVEALDFVIRAFGGSVSWGALACSNRLSNS